jgi:glycerol-3-phosphate acyltransferase PlsY
MSSIDQNPASTDNVCMYEYAIIPVAYLLGSISSAIIVCRLMGLPDPRTQGSNNPGATNVLRIGGKKAAGITLFGDMLKGFIPVALVHFLSDSPMVFALAGVAAFLGHLYPVFFSFKGGKGVATALGVQFGLHWQFGLAVAAIWLFMAKGLKISSLAALVSMALAPVIIWYIWPAQELLIMQVFISILLFWRHRSNIRNLISGAEDKIGGPETEKEEN